MALANPVAEQLRWIGIRSRLPLDDTHGGPGRRRGVQDVIDVSPLAGWAEILGKSDARTGQELFPLGNSGPGRLGVSQGLASEVGEAEFGMAFHDTVPSRPYPPIDLADLGSQAEGLTGDALICQAQTKSDS